MITFCSNNSTNNNKTNNINNNNSSEIKNNDNSYRLHFKKRTLIVFICLFVVSFFINLILGLCLHRKRSIIPNQQDKLILLILQ